MAYFTLNYETVDRFTERRTPFRDEHLRLVRDAHANGTIVMAGATGEPPDGALLIFQGTSADVAESFARQDPYVVNGLVVRWHVRPWHVVVSP